MRTTKEYYNDNEDDGHVSYDSHRPIVPAQKNAAVHLVCAAMHLGCGVGYPDLGTATTGVYLWPVGSHMRARCTEGALRGKG